MKTCGETKFWVLNPNLASKISYERILNNFQNEAVIRSGVLGIQGWPRMILPRLCGYCGGAVNSITSVFMQLHRSGIELKFNEVRLQLRV